MSDEKIIALVDDDESVRESLPDLLRSFGFRVQAFASANAFLRDAEIDLLGCLVLDVAMPGMTGPQLQQELIRQKRAVPIVFITAHSDDGAWSDLLN
jgi:FixJ family two-component response regulator